MRSIAIMHSIKTGFTLMAHQERINAKFIKAIRRNDLDEAQACLRHKSRSFWEGRPQGPAQIDARDSRGNSALMHAAGYGYAHIVKNLIAQGAPVASVNKAGENALLKAAVNGSVEIVADLLAAGLKVTDRDNQGSSALIHAVRAQKAIMVAFLIEKKSDVNIRDYKGKTPLHYAAQDGNLVALKSLLDAGAGINAQDDSGDTPLILAAARNQAAIVTELLARGCDTMIVNNNGNTAERQPTYEISSAICRAIAASRKSPDDLPAPSIAKRAQEKISAVMTGAAGVFKEAPKELSPVAQAMVREGLDPAAEEHWQAIGNAVIEHIVGGAASPRFLSTTFNFMSQQSTTVTKNLLTGDITPPVVEALDAMPNQQYVADAYMRLLAAAKNPPEYLPAARKKPQIKM